jgi:hypothetical protein
MRKAFLTSAIMLLGLVPAPAMPVAPLFGAPTITPVAMGCGPGWTRGPYGHCHPIGGYGVGVVAPVPGVGVVLPVPGVVVAPGPYHHCWIGRWGYRHCN